LSFFLVDSFCLLYTGCYFFSLPVLSILEQPFPKAGEGSFEKNKPVLVGNLSEASIDARF